MEDLGSRESSYTEFFLAEMVQLENIYKDMGEKSLSQEFCQGLSNSFSSSSSRIGKDSISWEQVQDWFRNKQKESQAKVPSSANSLKLVGFSDGLKASPNLKDERVPDLSELAFEARSSKDLAWYDVESFLSYRVVSSGELSERVSGKLIEVPGPCHAIKEVRVRFAGFDKNQDEWVNVKESVRERSIPLEPSECHKVKVGDLMLCFQEREDYAVYCDAYVVKVQRRLHDLTECRCIFVVRYNHDDTEEVVQWNRLCRRPTQEQPVVSLNPIADLWG